MSKCIGQPGARLPSPRPWDIISSNIRYLHTTNTYIEYSMPAPVNNEKTCRIFKPRWVSARTVVPPIDDFEKTLFYSTLGPNFAGLGKNFHKLLAVRGRAKLTLIDNAFCKAWIRGRSRMRFGELENWAH